jgi:hypothetical protein
LQGQRFDYIVLRLAQLRLSRRRALHVSAAGLAATAITARVSGGRFEERAQAEEATPTANATPGSDIQVEDMWLCSQPYALCTKAPCQLAAEGASVATCSCLVEDGYSLGFTACSERAPQGSSVISTFSTIDVTASTRSLVCPDGERWADCLDMPCEIDANDPSRAFCLCQVVASGEFVTIGGDCDASTCSSVIWSANTTDSPVRAHYETAMTQAGQTFVIPPVCPGATPSAA